VSVTTEQVTAIAGTLAAVGVPILYRLASKAGREIRGLRNQLEASLRYIFLLRRALAIRGVPKNKMPRPPKELTDADVWTDWTTEGGEDNDDTA
jgi:hypothetical protein